MTLKAAFIIELCDEIERTVPEWEYCSICRHIVPYLRKKLDTEATSPTRIRVRSLMRKMKEISQEKYIAYNKKYLSIFIK